MALRPAKIAPRGAPDGQRRDLDELNIPKVVYHSASRTEPVIKWSSSRAQDELEIPQDVPKMAPIGLKSGPRRPSDRPR